MRIGITTAFFQDWGGGIDFIRLVLRGLIQLSKQKDIEILFLVETEKRQTNARRTIKSLKGIASFFLLKKNNNKSEFSHNAIVDSLKNEGDFEWVFYNPNVETLKSISFKRKIDVLIPSFESLGSNFPISWVGYVFDCQHKYMPELFSKKDILERDASFNKILTESKSILVNSKQVKSDIQTFYGHHKALVHSLPFCPLFDFNNYNQTVLNAYSLLPQKYFLISNQFWKHKDHITALIAFSLYLKSNPETGVKLVCSGALNDYRDSNYSKRISDLISELGIEPNLILTGYIKKEEQKALMQNAMALIQPTLFEGGPGGGAVYEALGMGIPVILSDIYVNKEIESRNVLFFQAKNTTDLLEKMNEVKSFKRIAMSDLEKEKLLAETALGNRLWEIIGTLDEN